MTKQTENGTDYASANQTVTDWLQNDSHVRDLRELLLRSFLDAKGIFVVGGALRDRFLTPPRPPKDIDVVVAGISVARFQGIEGGHLNFFGGTTLQFSRLSIDMWRLEETYHIREFSLPGTISGFLSGAPFNLDKIAYDLQSATLHDDGCLAGIAARQIVYAPAHPYLEAIQALRCVLLKWKTGFTLHSSAGELLNRVAHDLSKDDSVVPEMKRYLLFLKQFYDESVFDRAMKEILVCAGEKS